MLERLESPGLLPSGVEGDKGETDKGVTTPTLEKIDFLAGGERIPGEGILKVSSP
jgi:hypothetical protein